MKRARYGLFLKLAPLLLLTSACSHSGANHAEPREDSLQRAPADVCHPLHVGAYCETYSGPAYGGLVGEHRIYNRSKHTVRVSWQFKQVDKTPIDLRPGTETRVAYASSEDGGCGAPVIQLVNCEYR
jgi:hypothetical protein